MFFTCENKAPCSDIDSKGTTATARGKSQDFQKLYGLIRSFYVEPETLMEDWENYLCIKGLMLLFVLMKEKYKARHIIALIDALSAQEGVDPNLSGFETVAAAINAHKAVKEVVGMEIKQRYLYDTYNKARAASAEEEIGFSPPYLKVMCKVLGKKSFKDFVEGLERQIPPQMKFYTGNWWSIVRANYDAYILKAPVRIFESEDGTQMRIEMKTANGSFSGTVEFRNNNLFCSLDSGSGKIFYMVMKTGTRKKPKFLQGVFSGISAYGDPIAGREIFLRAEKNFDEMEWHRLNMEKAEEMIHIEKQLFLYFLDPAQNCLKINDEDNPVLRGL